MHSGFAKLHTDGLSRLCGLNSQTNYTNIEAVSLTAAARISAFSQLSPWVKLGKSAATLHQPTNTGSEAPKTSFLCNWRVDNAWKTAQQSGVLAYMPEAELRHYAAIYRRLDVLNDYVLARITAVSRAAMYSIAQPDASLLSPAQTDDEVVLTTSALLAYTQTAALQYAMASQLHEFSSSPTLAEIRSIRHRPINPEADRAIQALIDKVFKLEKGLSDASDPN
jgi:hypothetical protein